MFLSFFLYLFVFFFYVFYIQSYSILRFVCELLGEFWSFKSPFLRSFLGDDCLFLFPRILLGKTKLLREIDREDLQRPFWGLCLGFFLKEMLFLLSCMMYLRSWVEWMALGS